MNPASPLAARRFGLILLAAMLSALPLVAAAAKPFQEADVSRWGADYRHFAMKTGGADACAQACAGDAKCKAWSYVKPGVAATTGECHLKSAVPEGNADACCISGIAGGASLVASTATAMKPTGMTGAIGKHQPASDDMLQMPIEAETPEALGVINAPVSLLPPE